MFNSYEPIFSRSWWLDAVAPKQWDLIEVEENNKVVAKLAFCIKKSHGFKILTQPMLTQVLGSYFDIETDKSKYSTILSRQKDLSNKLLDKLPAYDYFSQNFHYSFTNWLPLYWKGFQQSTRYTYVIENLANLDDVWSNFEPKIRTDIKKAQTQVVVRDDLGLEEFYKINLMTFERQNRQPACDFETLNSLDKACAIKNSKKIFFAQDSLGRVHAAIYIVWDEESAYYLMGGGDPALRNSGATSLLLWEAIKFASTVTKKFDFEGSMVESIERFFRGFGAIQRPYFNISKMNSRRFKLLKTIKSII